MKEFKPSATNALTAEISRMRKAGIRVINFGSGDPIIPNHPAVIAEAEKALMEKISPYSPVGGEFELREAAVQWMNHRYQSHYGIDHSIITCGGKFALYAALKVLLDPGDEVLFAAPYWPSYFGIASFTGGTPKPMLTHESSDWKLSPDEFKKHLTSKSRVFLFNNACNPTGTLYTRSEVEALFKIAIEANLTIISDEVYSEIVYDGARFVSGASFPEFKHKIVVIESCSKNFAMAGWRIGFAFGEPDLINNMIAVQSQTTTGSSRIGQRAAIGALQNVSEVTRIVREELDRRRKLFFKTYNELFQTSIKPVASAIYFFGKITMSAEEILKKAHVGIVPGEAFGLKGYARFSFAESPDEIVEGLKALYKITL